ncbi:MAG: DUF421 domain-containing protein [Bacillota bacterium]|nr:DUF421 domain-containing protein [Bacillota bacterium]
MEYSFLWKSLLMVLSSVFLLRFAGRKSLSQLSMAETVVMLSLGTIIVQPIVQSSVQKSILSAGVFVVTALSLEYLQLKFNILERIITGKSIIVIENGQLQIKNLKKLRLTIDQLEMRMRNEGISSFSDIKTATIEPNGMMGYEYNEDAKPLTVGEFKKIMDGYLKMNQSNKKNEKSFLEKNNETNIFSEISENKNNNTEKYLQ